MMVRRRHRENDGDEVRPRERGVDDAFDLETTVVGRGAQLEGTLVSSESIRIDGRAKGNIATRGDVILSSDSHVEADIEAQNVVTEGSLKGNITARAMTELAQGGRVQGKIRSKVLVVREGASFSGQSNMDLEDTADEADWLAHDESAFPEDDLRMAYEEAVRRAAEWYRSKLFGPKSEPDTAQARTAHPPAERRRLLSDDENLDEIVPRARTSSD
jgi:cytoskeletal protein CcmA (bactofilin family)